MNTGTSSDTGNLFVNPDADAARQFFQQHKSRRMTRKVTTVARAVRDLVKDGDYLAVGGFGTNRVPVSVLHEIVRQRKRRLGLSGHTATHDCQILVAGDCLDRCDVAYMVGLEARGLSRASRRAFESGRVQAVEWTNAALAWRYRAAAMGIPFIPARVMMGTDTAVYSAVKEITCPYTGIKMVALPALYPDVGIIHVHRSDVYGNCQIDGTAISDPDVARASRRLIVTTEKLVPHEDIRRQPDRTLIPYYCVDAVVEVPYGSYPGNMPYEYFSDEEHLREWLVAEESPETLARFMERFIYGVRDFDQYLSLCGGAERMRQLRNLEHMIDTANGDGEEA